MSARRILAIVTFAVVALSLTQCSVVDRIFGFFGVDVEAPTVLSVSPGDGSTDVAINAVVVTNFSEVMNTETAEYALSASPAINGVFSWSFGDRSMIFTPPTNLAIDTQYTITIGQVAEDEAGNALENNLVFKFTTGSTSDMTPPADVANFNAVPEDRGVSLSWTNPIDPDFAGVKAVFRTDRYPADSSDGSNAYSGTGTAVTHGGLQNGTTYYYAVFAYDQALNHSDGMNALAVPTAGGMEFNVVNLEASLVKYAENPILSPRSGYWDAVAGDPEVIHYENQYHMYYRGASTGPSRYPFGHIASVDATSWQNAAAPLSTLSSDTHTQTAVLSDDSKLKMWYGSWLDNSTDDYIRYAESDDGDTWTNDQLVLRHNDGTGNSWDQSLDYGMYLGSVLKDEAGTYHMWYTGRKPNAHQIGYATSANGTNWTKHAGNPVLDLGSSGSFDDAQQYVSDVFWDGDKYVMIYYAYSTVLSGYGIGLAYSVDGIDWAKDPNNPWNIRGNPGDWDSESALPRTVIKTGSTFHIWFDGYNGIVSQMGYATLN